MDLKSLKSDLDRNEKLIQKIKKHIKSKKVDLLEEISLTENLNELTKQSLDIQDKINKIELDNHNNRPLSERDSLLLRIDIEDLVAVTLPLYVYNIDDIHFVEHIVNKDDSLEIIKTKIAKKLDKKGNFILTESASFTINELVQWFSINSLHRDAISFLYNDILSNKLFIPNGYKYSYESKSEKEINIIFTAIKKYVNHNYKNYFNENSIQP